MPMTFYFMIVNSNSNWFDASKLRKSKMKKKKENEICELNWTVQRQIAHIYSKLAFYLFCSNESSKKWIVCHFVITRFSQYDVLSA